MEEAKTSAVILRSFFLSSILYLMVSAKVLLTSSSETGTSSCFLLCISSRRLTPRECARLQDFPDEFRIVVSDTRAYKQFGNSVVVPLMSNVAKLVTDKMYDLDKVTEKAKQGAASE